MPISPVWPEPYLEVGLLSRLKRESGGLKKVTDTYSLEDYAKQIAIPLSGRVGSHSSGDQKSTGAQICPCVHDSKSTGNIQGTSSYTGYVE